MLTRRSLLTAAAAVPATWMLARPAMAATPAIFSENGIAMRGTDPVAYFTNGAPIAGSAKHALDWAGAIWHFASAQNLETFMRNPHAYAPQYGGYCAFAMSKGAVATTDPAAWTIVEGRLYLNYSVNVRTVWSEDVAGNIALADGHWPTVLG